MLKSKECEEKAESLIFIANTLAISSSADLCKRFTVLDDVTSDPRDLVFLMTIAGVAAGVTSVDEALSDDEFEAFSHVLADRLMEWDFLGYRPYGDGGAYRAYVDLANFVKGGTSNTLETFQAMGFWLVFNLKGASPSEDEARAGIAIGQLLAVSFLDWWNRV